MRRPPLPIFVGSVVASTARALSTTLSTTLLDAPPLPLFEEGSFQTWLYRYLQNVQSQTIGRYLIFIPIRLSSAFHHMSTLSAICPLDRNLPGTSLDARAPVARRGPPRRVHCALSLHPSPPLPSFLPPRSLHVPLISEGPSNRSVRTYSCE